MDRIRWDVQAVILAVTFAAATVCMFMRLLSRALTRTAMWWDDYIAIVCYFLAIWWVIMMPFGLKVGLGLHAYDIPGKTVAEIGVEILHFIYFAEICYTTVLWLAKLSILLCYYRIFGPAANKWVLLALVVCSTIWGVIRLFLAIFHCNPIPAFWRHDIPGSHCAVDDSIFFFWTGIIHILLDVAILALPVLMVRALKLSVGQKVGVIMMFMFGIFVCGSALGIVITAKEYDSADPDVSYTISIIMIWATLEVNLVTVSACLPMVRPAWIFLSSWGRRSGRDGSGGSGGSVGGGAYGTGRSQTHKSIVLSTIPTKGGRGAGADSSSTAELAGSPAETDFEAHAKDGVYHGHRQQAALHTVISSPAPDNGSEDYDPNANLNGILVTNQTTIHESRIGHEE